MKDIIVINTSETILDRAVKYGFESGILDKEFVSNVRNLGAQMTVQFAAKFYKTHYAAYLRESFYAVLGVCNLGACLIGNTKDIAVFLRDNSFVALFQKGFTALKELSEKSQYCDSNQLTLLECVQLVAQYPFKKRWVGFEEYKSELERVKTCEQYHNFINWIVGSKFLTLDLFSKEKIAKTVLLSVIFLGKRRSNISLQDMFEVVTNFQKDKAQQKMQKFLQTVPYEFQPYARSASFILIEDVERLVRDGSSNTISIFFESFNTRDEMENLITLRDTLENNKLLGEK